MFPSVPNPSIAWSSQRDENQMKLHAQMKIKNTTIVSTNIFAANIYTKKKEITSIRAFLLSKQPPFFPNLMILGIFKLN